MYLTDMTSANLATYLNEYPAYRAKQAYEWLLRGAKPMDMSNLPMDIREKLNELPYGGATIEHEYNSAIDDTKKYLFKLEDGELIEGVLMSYHHGNTLCLSTQAGCRMGCAFCASGIGGLSRNLRQGEMLGMIMEVEKSLPSVKGERAVTNIVLMGSGEPLDNYIEVVAFLNRVVGELKISPRNISLSTCGIVPKIKSLYKDAPHVTLCVSLHAHSDDVRDTLVPMNKKYPIREVLAAAKEYSEKTGRRVIFEYALIEGVNAGDKDADALSERLRGINGHVNLIPLNAVKERELKGVTRLQAENFRKRLERNRISVTIRREMGTDIEGACGQLRRRAKAEGAECPIQKT